MGGSNVVQDTFKAFQRDCFGRLILGGTNHVLSETRRHFLCITERSEDDAESRVSYCSTYHHSQDPVNARQDLLFDAVFFKHCLKLSNGRVSLARKGATRLVTHGCRDWETGKSGTKGHGVGVDADVALSISK